MHGLQAMRDQLSRLCHLYRKILMFCFVAPSSSKARTAPVARADIRTHNGMITSIGALLFQEEQIIDVNRLGNRFRLFVGYNDKDKPGIQISLYWSLSQVSQSHLAL